MSETILVIPCYDEAARLRVAHISEYLEEDPDTDFIFVDDGSRDETLAILQDLEKASKGRVAVLEQASNQGKAEAVRRGMNLAFERGARFAGYFDADLATPLHELGRLRNVLLESDEIQMVFGSRVQLLGRRIIRRPLRHYLGRIFATAVSISLDLAIYDTQCGAKLFRCGALTRELFAERFVSNWVFDVEIIARWRRAEENRDRLPASRVIYELPLDEWVDVEGSKVRASDFLMAVLEVWRIHRRYKISGRNRIREE
jgi:glycosyltransferase involved in cell wall biosynthesis